MESGKNTEIIVGARAIAEAIGVTARRINFMVKRKEIPVFKMGGSIAIRRTKLEAWISEMEASAGVAE